MLHSVELRDVAMGDWDRAAWLLRSRRSAGGGLIVLTFDAATHTYFWRGHRVPNVTRVISHLTDYSRIPPDRLIRLQEEGRAVHSMVEMDCAGRLDVDSLPQWLRPHYRAWRRFLDETGFEPILSEYQVYHPTQCYAGTLDLLGEFKRLKGVKGIALGDVKRSLYAGPAIGLQLSGYDKALCTDPSIPRPRHRFSLRLTSEGKYHIDFGIRVKGIEIPFLHPDNDAAFLACLQQYRWRQKNYPEKENGNGST